MGKETPEATETAGPAGFCFPMFCTSARPHCTEPARSLEAGQHTCERAQGEGRQPHTRHALLSTTRTCQEVPLQFTFLSCFAGRTLSFYKAE